jgi:raffinose/stachyose/melibiose transport system substrate-binding protein
MFSSARRRLGAVSLLAAGALALTGCTAGSLGTSEGSGGTTVDPTTDDAPNQAEQVTLSLLVDTSEASTLIVEGLVDAFTADNPDVRINVETRPQGGEGDNIVKTRLATGDMTDIFFYNSGSLLQALDPTRNLVPMTDEPWVENLDSAFLASVRSGDDVFGAPAGAAMGGGILYNKTIYDDLGLEVPLTWDEFMANNAAIAEAGIAPVIQSYQDTWTSQLFVLADFHNVLAENSDWAEQYTGNQAKYVDEPALKSFQRLEAVHGAGYLNSDFASTSFEGALDKLVAGEGAHYPMLTFAVGPLVEADPAAAETIGFFAQPGDDAADNGLTVWSPAGLYVPKTTEGAKLEAAKRFLAFVASPEGCDAQTEAFAPSGPYAVVGCDLPDGLPLAVQDMLPYFTEGRTSPALEFVSPVKGPALEQITVEVGSGIRSAADGAALYDEDVKKQAQQLALEGW